MSRGQMEKEAKNGGKIVKKKGGKERSRIMMED